VTEADRSVTWQLEGSGPEAYERYLVPTIFGPWAERLIDEADPREGEWVLDVGYGTGIVARRAAARLGAEGRAVGVDVNESMLETARGAAAGIEPPIEWRRADATEIPFPDGLFDVAFCQQALQFMTERPAVLGEIRRVLAPGGRLALSVWRPIARNAAYIVLADDLERWVGDEPAAMVRSIFPEWEADDLRALLRDAGFEGTRITVGIGSMRYPSAEEFVRREAASSPLSGPLGSLDSEARNALIDNVAEGMRPYSDDDALVFPMESHIALARS
jgi:ubiquinone/menaquinone biosynthesis C-methylase UbiE